MLMLACRLWGAGGELELGRIFSDHMVLPMGREVPVWGRGDEGAEVEVRFGGVRVVGEVDGGGEWRVALPAMGADGEGRELVISSGEERVVIEDVLVGRVWMCSGQSNMDFPLARAVGGREGFGDSKEPGQIRLFNLTGVRTDGRVYGDAEYARLGGGECFEGEWRVADAAGAGRFSAIGWWFGCVMQERLGVPVGLVENAVGGSGTEAWLPIERLKAREEYAELTGDGWLESERMSAWARGRARLNLGGRLEVPHPFKPGYLFESGVRMFAGFPFDGVLWYQGETNSEVADVDWNGWLMEDLVRGWREVLGVGELPFFMVQLPRIGGDDPLRAHWPSYRAAQAAVAARVPGVRLVVTQDLGWDSPDVHPPDKRPVAMRLADAVMEAE
jgi:sialate O-acetylesterase